jgi:hypothetical protein
MHSLSSALTGTSSTQGIKKFDIFYDSLFINLKVADLDDGGFYEYLIIEKFDFDYNINAISSDKNYIIALGNTVYSSANATIGNGLINNILLDDRKEVLICALSSISNSVSGAPLSGASLMPIVFRYNINTSTLNKIYPNNTTTENWSTFVMGNFLSGQTPLALFDVKTDTLHYLFKTTVAQSGSAFNIVNDISFNYQQTLTLTNVQQLTSNASLTANFGIYDFVSGAVVDDIKTLVLHNGNKAQIVNLQ